MTAASSDTWKLARHLFGPPDLERGDWYWRRRRSPRKWDELVLGNWRAIWDLGEITYRYEVLIQVGKHRLPDLWGLYWEAFAAPDEDGMLHGMAMAYLSGEVHQRNLTQAETEALVRIVRSDESEMARLMGVRILEWQGYSRFKDVLQELAQDKSAQVSFEANVRLAELGEDTGDAILQLVPFLRYSDYEVRHVWRRRSELGLTPSHQELAMKLLTRAATNVRNEFWRFPEYPAARALSEFLELGVPAEDGDLDNIGRAVFTFKESRMERSTGRRIEFVRAIARFTDGRARDWLIAIQNAEALPKNVRAAAKRELKGLDSTPPQAQTISS